MRPSGSARPTCRPGWLKRPTWGRPPVADAFLTLPTTNRRDILQTAIAPGGHPARPCLAERAALSLFPTADRLGRHVDAPRHVLHGSLSSVNNTSVGPTARRGLPSASGTFENSPCHDPPLLTIARSGYAAVMAVSSKVPLVSIEAPKCASQSVGDAAVSGTRQE